MGRTNHTLPTECSNIAALSHRTTTSPRRTLFLQESILMAQLGVHLVAYAYPKVKIINDNYQVSGTMATDTLAQNQDD